MSQETCLVGRKFNAAGSEFTLGLRKAAAVDSFRILIWRAKRSTEVSKGKAELAFDQSMTLEAPYRRGPAGLPGLELTEIIVRSAQLGAFDKTKVLHAEAGDLDISFNLRGVGGALKALNDCESQRLVPRG